MLWGGFARIFFQHHVTWSVNSVCHFFGKRRFDVEDHSTNVFWLAIPSFGESWHHNHHAFPRSASHGLKWWEIDPSAMVIALMRRVGLAWDVVKITPERQAQKLVGARSRAARRRPRRRSRSPSPSRAPGRAHRAASLPPPPRRPGAVSGRIGDITDGDPATDLDDSHARALGSSAR